MFCWEGPGFASPEGGVEGDCHENFNLRRVWNISAFEKVLEGPKLLVGLLESVFDVGGVAQVGGYVRAQVLESVGKGNVPIRDST